MIAILPSNPAAAAAATNTPTFFDKKALKFTQNSELDTKTPSYRPGNFFYIIQYFGRRDFEILF